MLTRIYAFAVLASTVETLINAYRQRDFLLPVSLAFAALIVIVTVGILVAAFTRGSAVTWFRVHSWIALVLVADWQFQVRGQWPSHQHPWIWWAIGTAAISAGVGYRGWAGWVLQFSIPTLWVVIALQDFGGAHRVGEALQDAGFIFLLSATISSIVWALRDRARQADLVTLKVVTALAADYQSQALDREALAAMSMVHTQVLTPIEEALEAGDDAQRKVAAASANYALRYLDYRMKFNDLEATDAQAMALVESLERTISQRYPQVQIRSSDVESVILPVQVTLALIEGVLQAIDNAATHAGPEATIKLSFEGLAAGIKIVVSDNGRGFRVGRDTRGNLGVTGSIYERNRAEGIDVKIDTEPGKGTRVLFKWVKTR
jgi:signal transduction histidine kinase